jgi:hypothetical protein
MRDATKAFMQPEKFFESINALLPEKTTNSETDVVAADPVGANVPETAFLDIESPSFEILLGDITETITADQVLEAQFTEAFERTLVAEPAGEMLFVETIDVCLDTLPEHVVHAGDTEKGCVAEAEAEGCVKAYPLTLFHVDGVSSLNPSESNCLDTSNMVADCPIESSHDCPEVSMRGPETCRIAEIATAEHCPGSCPSLGPESPPNILSSPAISETDSAFLELPVEVKESFVDEQDPLCKRPTEVAGVETRTNEIQLALPHFEGLIVIPPAEPRRAKMRAKSKRDPPNG